MDFPKRRFAIGQLVRLRTRMPLQRDLTFLVMALLPPFDGSPQYRLRSSDEEFERIVAEADLVSV
jgi:hypothetical protein